MTNLVIILANLLCTNAIFHSNLYELSIPKLGTLRGIRRNGVVQFFGVPFAKTPVRYEQAEYPPDPWGFREASERESFKQA